MAWFELYIYSVMSVNVNAERMVYVWQWLMVAYLYVWQWLMVAYLYVWQWLMVAYLYVWQWPMVAYLYVWQWLMVDLYVWQWLMVAYLYVWHWLMVAYLYVWQWPMVAYLYVWQWLIVAYICLTVANGIYQNSLYGIAACLPMMYTNAVLLGNVRVPISIYVSDATVWKFESRFGFFHPKTAISVFKLLFFISFWKLTIEIAVSVFDFGLEAKTECLCLLLRSMTTSYYVVVSTNTLLQAKKLLGLKRKKSLKKV